MTTTGNSTFEEVLVDLVRERAKNIVQARSGWGAAKDLDMLDVRTLVIEARKLHNAGQQPPKRHVADWRDELRQPMQVIVSSVESICTALDKDPTGQKFADIIVSSATAVSENIDRLDKAAAVLDAGFALLDQAIDFDKQVRDVAVEVRDACHHAAVCAPLHSERPEDMIGRVNLDNVIKHVCGDGT